MEIIKCNKCGEEKDKNNYIKDKKRVDGLKNHVCKECHKLKGKLDLRKIEKPALTKLNDIGTLYKKDNYYSTAIIGSTKSGKTCLLNDLYKNIYKDYDLSLLFSINCHIENYNIFSKYGLCFDSFRPKLINMLAYINRKTKNYFNFAIFLDDEINVKYDSVLKNLITTLRNSNFSTFYSVQSHLYVQKQNRNNLQRLICLKLNSDEEIQEMAQRMLYGVLPIPENIKSKQDKINYICEFYRENTKDYNNIIVDNLENKCYCYKVVL